MHYFKQKRNEKRKYALETLKPALFFAFSKKSKVLIIVPLHNANELRTRRLKLIYNYRLNLNP